MANTKSAAKRARMSERRRAYNTALVSKARTAVRRVRQLLAEGERDEAQALLPEVQSALDKAAKVRAMHPNKASKSKARLAKLFSVEAASA